MTALILLGVLLASSQVMADCAVKPAQQNFDLSRFMGKWYFCKESNTMWHSDSKYKCNQLDFTLQPNGNDVKSDFTIFNTTSNHYETFTRTIRKENPSGTEGRLRIFREGFTGEGTMYTVLDTDYDNYAFVWMCRENAETGVPKEMPYAISRSQSQCPDQDKSEKNLPSDHTYVKSNQEDCPARN